MTAGPGVPLRSEPSKVKVIAAKSSPRRRIESRSTHAAETVVGMYFETGEVGSPQLTVASSIRRHRAAHGAHCKAGAGSRRSRERTSWDATSTRVAPAHIFWLLLAVFGGSTIVSSRPPGSDSAPQRSCAKRGKAARHRPSPSRAGRDASRSTRPVLDTSGQSNPRPATLPAIQASLFGVATTTSSPEGEKKRRSAFETALNVTPSVPRAVRGIPTSPTTTTSD